MGKKSGMLYTNIITVVSSDSQLQRYFYLCFNVFSNFIILNTHNKGQYTLNTCKIKYWKIILTIFLLNFIKFNGVTLINKII